MRKIDKVFYNRDAVTVAKELLGKMIVFKDAQGLYKAKIVETEAYMGITDKAAHSYGGRRTKRVEVMYGEPGHAYVYMIYGIHFCLNVVTEARDNPQAVLIRGIEPIEGIEQMAQNRYGKKYENLTSQQKKNMVNGPGKLCRALGIDRRQNGMDLCGDTLYIVDSDISDPFSIASAKRIGIDYAEEARDYLWRFYIDGNANVSVK
ncbi:DNA-3-methyladenine glycosylase [Fusibacter paucivorans]|uniref:Putative 3-methyladenine DNA glycosylase n=1 Tax=Fusibacter paucivorans TaxID=76009 RepID=A0ABS5PRR0_9FIRM|nr:DNA-3-methyladenine glycosylase [Fusibacter paucivorans]MBS7527855.1 DNA-3-methyladenine glycosylase [Fusibacter paucivorans]